VVKGFRKIGFKRILVGARIGTTHEGKGGVKEMRNPPLWRFLEKGHFERF